MKPFFCFLIAAAVMLTFTACGKKDAQAGTTSPSTTQSTAPSTTQSTAASTVPTEPEKKFEEIVLVDNEKVTVKITGVEQDPIWGYTLKTFVENKTDKELMFTVQNVSVNGFMCDPYWAVAVDAGKKSNSTISWLESSFQENGIEAVKEITFTLRAYDNGDWLADDTVNETFTIKP